MVKFFGMELEPKTASTFLYITTAIAAIQVLSWLGFDVLAFFKGDEEEDES